MEEKLRVAMFGQKRLSYRHDSRLERYYMVKPENIA